MDAVILKTNKTNYKKDDLNFIKSSLPARGIEPRRGKYFSWGTPGVGNSFQKSAIWGRVFDGAKMKNLDFQVYFG